MKLYFQNANGRERFIADVDDCKEADKKIKEFCSERNFYIPYIRTWFREDGVMVYDVSSHTEFFLLKNE